MVERSVRILQIKARLFDEELSNISAMDREDICFYRFIGGNPSESDELIKQLHFLKEKKVLLIGIFRFPFRFEGKKRLQTAIHQYYKMRDMCDAVTYFHSDGMMEAIDPTTPIKQANLTFNAFEDAAVKALVDLIDVPGEMNIDARDVQTFIKGRKGPLFLHAFEGDTFDEPLKYAISAPYLPADYTDGSQMIINIGCTQDVDMDAFRQMNLRLHDLFHKADLFKLGTYFTNEPGHRFKITLIVNGIGDPFPRPENIKGILPQPLWLKRKWKTVLKKGKETMSFR